MVHNLGRPLIAGIFTWLCDSARYWRATQRREDWAKRAETGGENQLRTNRRAGNSRRTRTGISTGNAALAAVGTTGRRGTTQPVEVAPSVGQDPSRH